MPIIDFRISGFFSGRIIFLGVLLLFIGLLVVLKSIIVGMIILLVSAAIFSTHYRLKIDYSKKEFFDYVWVLGFKNGDHGKFEKIEYLFIKKSRVSQKMNHIVGSATIQKEVYDGYLKFSDQEKIHLITQDNKKNLIEKLKAMSTKLKVRIVDYSEGEPKEI